MGLPEVTDLGALPLSPPPQAPGANSTLAPIPSLKAHLLCNPRWVTSPL